MASGPQRRTVRLDRRTKQARSERRDGRAALLDSAAEVFALRGLRDASVDEVAERAGYSKGAVYWHFQSKDDLFLALLEERIDRPMREMIGLLESAPPEKDMGPEASRRFTELLRTQRELLLLEHEYWSQAARDPVLRKRYRARQARLRRALGTALITRFEHLGAPALSPARSEAMATIVMGLASGLARERLIDPKAVPDDLLGNALVLLYKGTAAEGRGL
jgi:AcrR family transcriptional regulator